MVLRIPWGHKMSFHAATLLVALLGISGTGCVATHAHSMAISEKVKMALDSQPMPIIEVDGSLLHHSSPVCIQVILETSAISDAMTVRLIDSKGCEAIAVPLKAKDFTVYKLDNGTSKITAHNAFKCASVKSKGNLLPCGEFTIELVSITSTSRTITLARSKIVTICPVIEFH